MQASCLIDRIYKNEPKAYIRTIDDDAGVMSADKLNKRNMRSHIKSWILCLGLTAPAISNAQKISSNDPNLVDAFNLAINTIDINVRRGVLAAGGDYGGEWTRDAAINSWNAESLLRPVIAENSLWSVTIKKDSIGHQYWDKIIWTIAALNHYKVTGDKVFLKQAYRCAGNTIKALENSTYDHEYGLFMGPSVFNDGIAGYPESVYDSLNNSSLVLDHPRSRTIKCLSTNAVYYASYKALADMSNILNDDQKHHYEEYANHLKTAILKHFYNEKENKLYYLIDSQGKPDASQEGLGVSFAILFDILNRDQAAKVLKNISTSAFGIPSITPAFARYSTEKPGRHNEVIWPMVNGFYADAALKVKDQAVFTHEFRTLIHLALDEDKGNYNFREIYNAGTGIPDGGWQRGNTPTDIQWPSFKNQTWSATAYLRMVFNGLLGFKFSDEGLTMAPFLPEGVTRLQLDNIPYRKTLLNITVKGKGDHVAFFTVNGKKQTALKINATATGTQNIIVNVE